MIIALGVYNKSRKPKGPLLESIKYTINPITTGGNPIKVFIRFDRNDFPLKSLRAKNELIGRAIDKAISVEVAETLTERNIIPQTSGSNENNGLNA